MNLALHDDAGRQWELVNIIPVKDYERPSKTTKWTRRLGCQTCPGEGRLRDRGSNGLGFNSSRLKKIHLYLNGMAQHSKLESGELI